MKNTHLVLSLTALIFFGCSKSMEKVKEDFMPIARGEADEIILVVDSALYDGPVGDQIKSMYNQLIVGLPQDEYKFKVRKVNPLRINSFLKNASNMIFVMTLNSPTSESQALRQYFSDKSLKMVQRDSSLYMTLRKDEFAKGQLVLYLFGQNEEQLVENLKKNEEKLVDIFESRVLSRTREKVLAKTQSSLMSAIQEDHSYSIDIPFGYDLSKNLKNFVWIRKLEAQSEYNVFIYEAPYVDNKVFENIGKLRDEITQTYMRDSEKPELFIDRQDIIPVLTESVNFNGKFAIKGVGLWMVSNKSAGGPFISYTLVDEANQILYYIEGYIYSPGTKKKKPLREVEAIISTFKTPTEVANASKNNPTNPT
ncbi:MAG: DUF4837 family protein [Cyclobacteriaceae bacterium]